MTKRSEHSRETYPSLARQKHPKASGSSVEPTMNTPLRTPSPEDLKIAQEIITIDKEWKPFHAKGGEWEWINEHKRKDYIDALKNEDADTLAYCLANMFRLDASYGVVTPGENVFALENDILLDLDALAEFGTFPILPIKNYKECGNLYGMLTKDGVIAPDAPRFTYFAGKIIDLLKDKKDAVVLEIGGGYGGLCREILVRKKLKYIDCDLPETLYLCYFFLKKVLPKASIGWGYDVKNDISLVPAHEKDTIRKADLFFNSNSFSEMDAKSVAGYIEVLHKLKPRYFLHQNSNFLLFPDSERHIEVLASKFPIDLKLYRDVYAHIAAWQGAGGRYREYLYERK